MHYLHLDNIPR